MKGIIPKILLIMEGGVVMWLNHQSRRERCAELLLLKMRELKRKPTAAEMRDDSRMPDPNDYAFYWRSFDEAVDTIWLQADVQTEKRAVVRNFAKMGGIKMAKTKQEWLDWLLESGGGELPNYVVFKREHPSEAAEVLKLFGTWHGVELMSQNQEKGAQSSERVIPPERDQPLQKAEQQKKAQVKSKVVAPIITEVEAAQMVVRVYEYLHLEGRLPSQNEINAYNRQYHGISYGVLLDRLGPKDEWAQKVAQVLGVEMMDKLKVAKVETKGVHTMEQSSQEKRCEEVETKENKVETSASNLWMASEVLAKALGPGSIKLRDVKLTVEQDGNKYSVRIRQLE